MEVLVFKTTVSTPENVKMLILTKGLTFLPLHPLGSAALQSSGL